MQCTSSYWNQYLERESKRVSFLVLQGVSSGTGPIYGEFPTFAHLNSFLNYMNKEKSVHVLCEFE